MIENTYANCKNLAQLSVDSMDVKSLIEFYQVTLLDRLLDSQEAFEAELENMGIKTQGELDGDNCPVIGGFPLPEDIDE